MDIGVDGYSVFFFFSSRRRHTRLQGDWSSDVCSSDLWKVGFAALKHYWLFGAGFSNFPVAYNQYFLTVWNTFYTGWSRGPHNIILEAAVELGVVGLALLCLGWWYTFRALRHIPRGHRFYDLRIMIEGGIFGTFVNALFVHIMLQKFTWWMFAITVMAATV